MNDPIHFDAEGDVRDLTPIPKEFLLKLDNYQLDALKSRWWWLFGHSAEVENANCCTALFVVLDEMGEKSKAIEVGDEIREEDKEVTSGDLHLWIRGESDYEVTWKGKKVVSYAQKLCVPGEWISHLRGLYLQVMEMRDSRQKEVQEKERLVLVDMLVAE